MEEHLENPGSLLEELDSQQDQVLAGLDELNVQIEDVLKQWQAGNGRSDAEPPAEAA